MLKQQQPKQHTRPRITIIGLPRWRWQCRHHKRTPRRRLTVEPFESRPSLLLISIVLDAAATMDVFASAECFFEDWAPEVVVVPDAF